MPDTLRVRFAPSPTGYLHVGGARTALFNWLLARKHDGVFLLRIEDTDPERSTDEHVRAIKDGMEWLGLEWDGNLYFQSHGFERHRVQAHELLDAGTAYKDFAEPGHPPERDGAPDDPYAIRFDVPAGVTTWDDLVHGEMRFENEEIDDFVILRRDGTPTYNFAVVSDDVHMDVTHVVRGDDHLSNTPKQIMIYEAMGLPVPEFGHVPMILGDDGKRLSKRHGATAVGAYADRGIVPDAMCNFLALMGWSPGDDREVMDRAELVSEFSMERVLKKSAVFDTEKLEWLNGQHLARTPGAEIAGEVRRFLVENEGVEAERIDERGEAWLRSLTDLLKVRYRTLVEVAEAARVYVADEVRYEPEAVRKRWLEDEEKTIEYLETLRERLAETEWDAEALEEAMRALADDFDVSWGKLIHPLRVAVVGEQASPGIFDTLVHVGREASLERIDRALEMIRSGEARKLATSENSLLDTGNYGTLG